MPRSKDGMFPVRGVLGYAGIELVLALLKAGRMRIQTELRRRFCQ